jgi:hypothetical protein
MMWEKKMTVVVVLTLLEEMQLPLYSRGDGSFFGDHKKKIYWGAVGAMKLSHLP